MKTDQISFKKEAAKYGLVLGVSLALITTLLYILSLDLFVKWWLQILLFIGTIGFSIFATLKCRKILGGFISFKDAFTAYFICVALGVFISTLVSIIIFAIVDPGAAEYVKDKSIEATIAFMERFNTPEAEMEKAIAAAREQDNFSIGAQLKAYVFSLAFLSVIGLIIALIVKRKDPNLD